VRIRLVAAFVLCALPRPVSAHVAPSVNENNRYLRVTALGDRIRIAYTVFLGEVPGEQARRRLDADRDGMVEENEADTYGRELGKVLEGNLALELDGAPTELRWSEIHVGLGTPATSAGAFSVDLIAWLCLADSAKPEHSIWLRDTFRVPLPGETEVLVEESPGVTVTRAALDEHATEPRLKSQWRGDRDYLREHGLRVEFRVDPSLAVIESPEACARAAAGAGNASPAPTPSPTRRGRTLLLGLAVLAGSIVVVWAARRYRKTNG
jgi:hypothetical protein